MPSEVNSYPIGAVAKLTGLRPDRIRVWERRYGAIRPQRTDSNHRRYTSSDIERLKLLQKAAEGGHSLASLASLSNQEIMALTVPRSETLPSPRKRNRGGPEALVGLALEAVRQCNLNAFEELLEEAALQLDRFSLLEDFVGPLLVEVGSDWNTGKLRIWQKHLAFIVSRTFMDSLGDPGVSASAPRVVIATPIGHLHELGAQMAVVTARSIGWRPVYLGVNLPAEEIAAAAEHCSASVVALSLIYPAQDMKTVNELHRLVHLLPENVKFVIGGQLASRYKQALADTDTMAVQSLREFRDCLTEATMGFESSSTREELIRQAERKKP